MRISAKGRYALASLSELAKYQGTDEPVSVISIAEKLNISKIFLEQIFSALKKDGILISVKGKNGGYRLAENASEITVYAALLSVENALFESADNDPGPASAFDLVLSEMLWDPLDAAIKQVLSAVTIRELYEKTLYQTEDSFFMQYM